MNTVDVPSGYIIPALIENLERDHRGNRGLTSTAYYYHNVIIIMLGEFEYLLIGAAARLGEDAYGTAIKLEIEKAAGRACSIGALYTTLDRLEAKGLVQTWMGEATAQRGGRPKRMVRVTRAGAEAAGEFYRTIARVSRGLSWATK